MSADIERLALTLIWPGFEGSRAPAWVRRRLEEGLGGVVLYAWNVESTEQLSALTADLRAESPNVLVAIDEEGGDVTRLEAGTGSSYPGNAALGVVDDVDLTARVDASLAADLGSVGVSLDFAPVADVNSNPENPVIGIRSFGADPVLVARHVAAFVRGLQSGGIAACAKHFPGHGDTDLDSHLQLPSIAADRETILARELAPFRAAIEAGVRAIMTAHIVAPALDVEPATTSGPVLSGLLREELGFDGLVVTDALEMRAISARVGVEEGAVRAVAAGADALCLGHDLFDESVVSVQRALVGAVRNGRLSEDRLAEAASRVRGVAEWVSGGSRAASGERGIGRAAARRALLCVGDHVVSQASLVVELEPEPSMAAGRLAQRPGEWLAAVLPGASLVRFEGGAVEPVLEEAEGRQLVLVVRDAHRHRWQRDAVESLLARAPDAVVVEIGLPEWRPASAGYVATYGAGRVNVEAAAERLYSEAATRGGAVR